MSRGRKNWPERDPELIAADQEYLRMRLINDMMGANDSVCAGHRSPADLDWIERRVPRKEEDPLWTLTKIKKGWAR